MSVLDVGAGVGKLCVAAAREATLATFVGVEWRPHLALLATEIARRLDVPNVRFISADALALDWSLFDAFYFFNPFGEHFFNQAFAIDRTIDFGPLDHIRYVDGVLERLAQARPGTRLVTYHGFGASPPSNYDRVTQEWVGTDCLELWVKQ